MTKQEFEKRIGRTIPSSDYEKIEVVYTFHPSIDETEGKAQIAMLYGTFGMRVIEDMLPSALKAQELEDKRMALRRQLDEVNEEYRKLKC